MSGHFLAFMSFVDEDADFALKLSTFLNSCRIPTWHYKKDTVPGPTYISQIRRAICDATVLVPLLSPTTIANPQQINAEIMYAFESRKFFLPILVRVDHEQVKEVQPDWVYCFGASTSIRIDSFDDEVALKKIDSGFSLIRKASTSEAADGGSDRKLLLSFLGRTESDVAEQVSADVYKRFRVPAGIDWCGFSLTWRTLEARGGDLDIYDDCILLQFIDKKVINACFVNRILQHWFDPNTGRPKLEFYEPIISVGPKPFDKQVTNPCILNW